MNHPTFSAGEPTLVIESLGAGVQSTAMFVLACRAKSDPAGTAGLLLRYRERLTPEQAAEQVAMLARLDAAVFADTHWEPRHVMEHLGNLQQYGAEHGVAVHLASRGSLPDDVLNPQVFATIPGWTQTKHYELVPIEWGKCPTCLGKNPLIALGDEVCEDCHNQCVIPTKFEKRHTKSPKGRIKRQCTPKYKIEVIQRQVRIMLGADEWFEDCRYCGATGQRVAPWEPGRGVHECDICRGTGQRRRVGSVPKGAWAEQWIGFSTDEIERVSDGGFPAYQKPVHPLLDLRWTRSMCEMFLDEMGWQAEKSACIGCPFHDDDVWIDMKNRDPRDFAKAVSFDEAYRNGSGMDGQRFLHESRLPLAEAVARAEAERKAAGEQLLLFGKAKRPQRRGCSPYGCRTVEYVEDEELQGEDGAA